MTRHVCLVLVVIAALGCNREDEPSPPPAVTLDSTASERDADTNEDLKPSSSETETAVEPPQPTTSSPASTRPEEPTPAGAARLESEPSAAEAAAATPPRDLAQELRDALGDLTGCINDYQPASPTTIRVEITARVRPTGMIIEPNAQGTGLSRNDQQCIADRIGALVLDPLEGSSSESVVTSVEVRYEPPTVREDDVSRPPPTPEGVVEPLPKKDPIAPSGVPIEGPASEPIEGPEPVPIDGPRGVPIEGPTPVPIESD